MAKPFQTVDSAKLRRSLFDLSYNKLLTCDFRILYPIMCDEMVPGDKFTIGESCVIRFNPLVAPIMHNVSGRVHYFFYPYRLLDKDWEEIISGGLDGRSTKVPPSYKLRPGSLVGSLWDYLGFPTDINVSDYNTFDGQIIKPIDYPRRAYYGIWTDYYQGEDFALPFVDIRNSTGEFDLDKFLAYGGGTLPLNGLLPVFTRKDYFTSALFSQQRGPDRAIPLTGIGSAIWPASSFVDTLNGGPSPIPNSGGVLTPMAFLNNGLNRVSVFGDDPVSKAQIAANNASVWFNSNSFDFSQAGTFDVSDLRTYFQLQLWSERNSRAGIRQTEFLRSHFGVSPRDERLQRPEYIGGRTIPINISEVLQTSASESGVNGSKQANMAGHGIAVGGDYIGTYYAKEFGLVMGLLSFLPESAYEDRIDRQWLKPTRYDFYFPEFTHLSEQGIYNAEIRYNCITSPGSMPQDIFGFQGRYDEMRIKHNQVCGLFRQSVPNNFSHWHCGRHFAGITMPLSFDFATFIEANQADGAKRILAVPSEPTFLVHWRNHIKATRPIPREAIPGLIDHMS